MCLSRTQITQRLGLYIKTKDSGARGRNTKEMRGYLLDFNRGLGERDSYHEDLSTLSFTAFGMNLLLLPRLHLR